MPDRKIRSTDWPYSLLDNVVFENDEGDIFEGTPDQIDGLQYALSTLYERENKVLLMRYRDGKTLDDCARACNVTRERVRQIESKALRKLRHPQRLRYILNGLYGEEKRIATEKLEKARAAADALEAADKREEAQRWIPVGERLPTVSEYRNGDKFKSMDSNELVPFLVCCEDTEIPFRAFYDGKNWGDGWGKQNVTHWQALPEPPQKG